MIASVARATFAFCLAVGAATLVKSYAGVGDGFSAGAFAGLGAAVQYACLDHERAARLTGARFAWRLIGAGLVLALGVQVGPVLLGVMPATHAPAPGAQVLSIGAAEVHTALLFDLGTALLVYGAWVGTFDRLFPPFPFAGGRP